MRLSRWLAAATKLSRRKADEAIKDGRVKVNAQPAEIGQRVEGGESITLDNRLVKSKKKLLLLLNKPAGYVCTKDPQGDMPSVYELLPDKFSHLSYAGRLDADSEGLLIMSNDGQLIQQLTHPKYEVNRSYLVQIVPSLSPDHAQQLTTKGVELNDGISKFDSLKESDQGLIVSLHEGRNRQIRRTFELLGYEVTKLCRLTHGQYTLGDIPLGEYIIDEI